jgi:hypothetical protein
LTRDYSQRSKDQPINHEVGNDRAAFGGKLAAAEKAQVNRQQNRQSRCH